MKKYYKAFLVRDGGELVSAYEHEEGRMVTYEKGIWNKPCPAAPQFLCLINSLKDVSTALMWNTDLVLYEVKVKNPMNTVTLNKVKLDWVDCGALFCSEVKLVKKVPYFHYKKYILC